MFNVTRRKGDGRPDRAPDLIFHHKAGELCDEGTEGAEAIRGWTRCLDGVDEREIADNSYGYDEKSGQTILRTGTVNMLKTIRGLEWLDGFGIDGQEINKLDEASYDIAPRFLVLGVLSKVRERDGRRLSEVEGG